MPFKVFSDAPRLRKVALHASPWIGAVLPWAQLTDIAVEIHAANTLNSPFTLEQGTFKLLQVASAVSGSIHLTYNEWDKVTHNDSLVIDPISTKARSLCISRTEHPLLDGYHQRLPSNVAFPNVQEGYFDDLRVACMFYPSISRSLTCSKVIEEDRYREPRSSELSIFSAGSTVRFPELVVLTVSVQ